MLSVALLLALLGSPVVPVTASDPKVLTDDLVARINHARVAAGLMPLARASELDAAAQAHSLDMVAHDYIDHTGSDGSEPQQRAEQAGYKVPPQSAWIVVEVVSAISGDPQGPLEWWLGDDQHRKVLLNPRWREIGAGYGEGGEYGHYWTVDVGCRPGVLPPVALDGTTYTPTEQCGDPESVAAFLSTAAEPLTASATSTATSVPSTAVPTPSPPGLAPTVAVPTVGSSVAPVTSAAAPTSTVVAPVTVAVSPDLAAAGDSVNVRWSGLAVATPTDWFGLYRPGDGDKAFLIWTYVGCAPIPLDSRPLGSCNVTLPRSLQSGTYEFRLFRDNDYVPIRVSPPIHVG